MWGWGVNTAKVSESESRSVISDSLQPSGHPQSLSPHPSSATLCLHDIWPAGLQDQPRVGLTEGSVLSLTEGSAGQG